MRLFPGAFLRNRHGIADGRAGLAGFDEGDVVDENRPLRHLFAARMESDDEHVEILPRLDAGHHVERNAEALPLIGDTLDDVAALERLAR